MKYILLLLILVIPFQVVYAQEIMFSTGKSDYFFKVGEEALIPVDSENNFGKSISGNLRYTITQQINQGNFQFSNSKTNVNTFTVNDGNNHISLNFGTSDAPAIFVVNLDFNHNEGSPQTVSLGPITINFVSDDSQKNNQSKPIHSTSKDTPAGQSDPFIQQQQMQQKLDQMFGNQQLTPQDPPQDPQQRLQNNQMSQDSTALKQQIQQQLQQKEQIQREFGKLLAANLNFTNSHNHFLKSGYNVTSGKIESTSNNTGSFEIQYQNQDGKWATLKGKMDNGTITEIRQQTQEQQEKLLEKLEQNNQFQEFKKQLVKENFSQNHIEFQYNENKTSIVVEFQGQNKNNATITGIFENEDIESIILNNQNSDPIDLLWWITIAISIAGVLIALLFVRKKFSKKKLTKVNIVSPIQQSQVFDYVLESQKMIKKAQQVYSEGKHQDAFGIAGHAIRLFLSHDIGLKKEITNEELIPFLTKQYPVEDISECLKTAELVEFAKSESTEADFRKIVSLFEKLVKN